MRELTNLATKTELGTLLPRSMGRFHPPSDLSRLQCRPFRVAPVYRMMAATVPQNRDRVHSSEVRSMMVSIPGAAVQSACPGVIRPDICGSEYNYVSPATCEHPDFQRRACSSLDGITYSRTPAMFIRIFPGLKTRQSVFRCHDT